MDRDPKLALFLFIFLFSFSVHAGLLAPVSFEASTQGKLEVVVNDENGLLSNAEVWVEDLYGRAVSASFWQEFVSLLTGVSSVENKEGIVTAYAPGHSAVSVQALLNQKIIFELPKDPKDEYSFIGGNLGGFDRNQGSGEAKVGFISRALSRDDVAQFDLATFISPVTDKIEVYGERKIPSNFFLPDQTVFLYFIPVHLNKPSFHLPALVGSEERYFGVTALVDLKDAVEAATGDNPFSAIEGISFKKIGYFKKIKVSEKKGESSLVNLTTNLSLNDRVILRPGKNTTTEGESRRMVASLFEPEENVFIPTNVKLVGDDRITLFTPLKAKTRLVDVIVSADYKRFRGAWISDGATRVPDGGLSARLDFSAIDGNWNVKFPTTSKLLVTHFSEEGKNSLGGTRVVERWLLIGPKKENFHVPPLAYKALSEKAALGGVTHVSVDGLEFQEGDYPLLDGKKIQSSLKVLEKVRKKL